MALLDEIGDRLAAQAVAGTSAPSGWVIVKGWLPDSSTLPDTAVALIETGGLPPDGRTDLDRPTFQLLVRGASMQGSTSAYTDARTKAEDAKTALHALAPDTYSGRYYAGLWAEQEPFLLEIDANHRPTFATNYRAMRSRTT